MNRIRLYTICLLLVLGLVPLSGYSQPHGFLANDSVEIIAEQRFGGNALWGYMNGGADLYLEYGFSVLLVQDINWKGIKLKAEIYLMRGEPQAYGIFSVHAGDQILKAEKGYYAHNDWQFQASSGSYYISVTNTAGTPLQKGAAMEAGHWWLQSHGTSPLEIPEMPKADHAFGPVKHGRGMLGMRAASPEINPLFRELEGYTLWLRVNHKTREIVGRLEAPLGLMNYLQVKARVMDTPLGDIYVTEFKRLNNDTALFRCIYRDRSKDAKDP